MKTKLFFALLAGLILALSITPAFAQGRGTGDRPCFGGNTTVESGEAVDTLSVFGCNATVKSGGTVRGDATVFGGNLTLESGSNVNGNVAIVGGNANIAGTVNGDIAIAGGSVNLNPSAVVNGSVRVAGGSLNRSEGSTVRGGVTQENSPRFAPSFGRVFTAPFFQPFNGLQFAGFNLIRDLITALALAALGALLVVFFPQPTQRVMATVQSQIGPSFGVGCITLLLAPVLFLLLLITIVGPVLLVIALAAAWIFGWIAVGYLAGERILEAFKAREIAPVLAVVVGVFILAVIGAVPCLGGLISLLIGTLGIGAVILTRFGTRPYPFTPAWAPAGPMGPLPPGPVSNPPAPMQPASPPPTMSPQAEDKPSSGSGTFGPGEPQI